MMKRLVKFLKISTAMAVAAGVVALGSTAQADVWVGLGADNEYSTPGNWDTNVAPSGTATGDINGVFTVVRSVNSTANRVNVNGGATLNITGGVHSNQQSGNTVRDFIGTVGSGVVNQSGGTVDSGHINILGNGAGNSGTYNLTGGTYQIGRGGNSFMGIAGGSSLEIAPSGGAVGVLNFSGGTFVTRIGVGVGATGVFDVMGNAAGSMIEIGANGSLSGAWTQAAGGILRTGLGATGSTVMNIDLNDGTGNGLGIATFAAGSILDPYDFGGAAANVWTTIMNADGGIVDSGLILSGTALGAGWEKQIVGNELQVRLVSAIPEPSSLALLGLGGLVLLGRRRKKA